jgi:hypothetical protein
VAMEATPVGNINWINNCLTAFFKFFHKQDLLRRYFKASNKSYSVEYKHLLEIIASMDSKMADDS